MASDGHRNVLVTGYDAGSAGLDALGSEVRSPGGTVWLRRCDSAGGDDTGYAITADAEGNVLVAGGVTASSEYSNVWVRKQAP